MNIGKLRIELKKNNILSELDSHRLLSDSVLRKKYIELPFSVIDTKTGPWKQRRKLWYKLGIQSELGRGEKFSSYSGFGSWLDKNDIERFGKKEIAQLNVSIFDPVLCEIMYEWFCPDKGTILDPFAGGSVRGIVANVKGFYYIGIDLNSEQINSNMEQAYTLCKESKSLPVWVQGDANVVLDKIEDESYDFVFSCPPYFDLEKYTDDENDLSNMSDEDFLINYESIIKKSIAKLKNNRFACFVVGEVRNKKGFYRNLVSNTIQMFEKHGCNFYNDMVLLRPIANAGFRVGKQFPNYRKIVRLHQNVLVFYKGDNHKDIKDISFNKVINP